jgi:hypothetical protein
MRYVHIIAGLLSIASGALALFAAKGSPLHRRSGLLFVVAMLTMTSSAVLMAAFTCPNMGNVTAGLLTFYLVGTALLTVRPLPHARGLLAGLMLIGATAGVLGLRLGIDAMHSVKPTDSIPWPPLLMFGIAGLLGTLLDARLLLGHGIQGAHRLARHLWRMTFAMWIATTSFFLGQARFLPEAVRSTGLNLIPVLVVTVLLFYWLVRVLRRKRLPPTTHGTGERAAAAGAAPA